MQPVDVLRDERPRPAAGLQPRQALPEAMITPSFANVVPEGFPGS